MKLSYVPPSNKKKPQGGAIFFISCCNIAPHLWLSFLKTILVTVNGKATLTMYVCGLHVA